jgi:hypothetical protein
MLDAHLVLLQLDHRDPRCRPGRFRPETAGPDPVLPHHHHRSAARGIRPAGRRHDPRDRVSPVPAAQRRPISSEPCTSCPYMGLCLGQQQLVDATLVRRSGEDLGLFDELTY